MADFEDMNATPLGKLPLPAVQSKGDGPRVDMGGSYSDILKEMTAQPHQAAAPQAQASSLNGSHAQFQQQFQQQFQPPQVAVPGPRYDMAPQGYRRHQRQPRRRAAQPAPRKATARRASKGGGVMAKLRDYKTSLLVAFVVFLVLLYAAPKLAQAVPHLLTPAGKFNSLGLLVIAASCGGIHRVLDHYVRC